MEIDETHLKPVNIEVSQTDGSEMEIIGIVDLTVRIGNLETAHGIYISPSLSRELTIRGDWLKWYNVSRFDPQTLIPSKEEILLSNLSEEDMKLPPRTAVLSIGRLNNHNDICGTTNFCRRSWPRNAMN